jgi:DNA-directed RNA polymerase alpha subunit
MEIQPPTEDISRLDRIEAELAEMKSIMDIQLRLRSAESVPIEDLDFSMRVYNALKRKRIHTLATLLTYTTTDLLSIRNFGINSLSEVQSVLCLRGLVLRQKRASP